MTWKQLNLEKANKKNGYPWGKVGLAAIVYRVVEDHHAMLDHQRIRNLNRWVLNFPWCLIGANHQELGEIDDTDVRFDSR